MMIMGPDTYRKKADKRQRYIPLAFDEELSKIFIKRVKTDSPTQQTYHPPKGKR